MLFNPTNTETPTYTPQLHADQRNQYRTSQLSTSITCYSTQPIQNLPPTHHNSMLTNPTCTEPITYKSQLHVYQPNQYRHSHLHYTITCWLTQKVLTLPPTNHNYMLKNTSSKDSPTYTPQLHAEKPNLYRRSHLHTTITCWPKHPVKTPITCWKTQPT